MATSSNLFTKPKLKSHSRPTTPTEHSTLNATNSKPISTDTITNLTFHQKQMQLYNKSNSSNTNNNNNNNSINKETPKQIYNEFNKTFTNIKTKIDKEFEKKNNTKEPSSKSNFLKKAINTVYSTITGDFVQQVEVPNSTTFLTKELTLSKPITQLTDSQDDDDDNPKQPPKQPIINDISKSNKNQKDPLQMIKYCLSLTGVWNLSHQQAQQLRQELNQLTFQQSIYYAQVNQQFISKMNPETQNAVYFTLNTKNNKLYTPKNNIRTQHPQYNIKQKNVQQQLGNHNNQSKNTTLFEKFKNLQYIQPMINNNIYKNNNNQSLPYVQHTSIQQPLINDTNNNNQYSNEQYQTIPLGQSNYESLNVFKLNYSSNQDHLQSIYEQLYWEASDDESIEATLAKFNQDNIMYTIKPRIPFKFNDLYTFFYQCTQLKNRYNIHSHFLFHLVLQQNVLPLNISETIHLLRRNKTISSWYELKCYLIQIFSKNININEIIIRYNKELHNWHQDKLLKSSNIDIVTCFDTFNTYINNYKIKTAGMNDNINIININNAIKLFEYGIKLLKPNGYNKLTEKCIDTWNDICQIMEKYRSKYKGTYFIKNNDKIIPNKRPNNYSNYQNQSNYRNIRKFPTFTSNKPRNKRIFYKPIYSTSKRIFKPRNRGRGRGRLIRGQSTLNNINKPITFRRYGRERSTPSKKSFTNYDQAKRYQKNTNTSSTKKPNIDYKNNNPNNEPSNLNHITCYKCKKKGHYANKCPTKLNNKNENERKRVYIIDDENDENNDNIHYTNDSNEIVYDEYGNPYEIYEYHLDEKNYESQDYYTDDEFENGQYMENTH